jgi:hypothetical protein
MTDNALTARLAASLIALALSLSACTYILGDSLSSAPRPCVVDGDCDPGQACAAGRCGAPLGDAGVEGETIEEDLIQDQASPDSQEPDQQGPDQGAPDQAEDVPPPEDASPEDIEAPDLPPDDQGEEDQPPEEVAEDLPELPPTPMCRQDSDCEVGICDPVGICVLQCDDALPCLGTLCAPQACVSGRCVEEPVRCEEAPPPACVNEVLITAQGEGACDEASGRCVFEMTGVVCAEQGTTCQPMTCDAAAGACVAAAPAPNGTDCDQRRGRGFCYEGECGSCERDEQCPASGDPCMVNTCRGGQCVLTAQNRAVCGDPCQPGICNSRGICVLGAPMICADPVGLPCLEGFCDPAQGMCDTRPRENGRGCSDDALEGVCFGGTCVACIADGDCARHPLAPCQENVCVNNACVEGPIMPGMTCGAPDRYCTPSGRCVQCEVDGECDDENACTTDTCTEDRCQNEPVPPQDGVILCMLGEGGEGVCREGACVECVQDTDCQSFSDNSQRCAAPFCNQGVCDEVALPDGQRCQSERAAGVCVDGQCQTACDTSVCTGGDACATLSCQAPRTCRVSYLACEATSDCAACDPDPMDCVAVTCVASGEEGEVGNSPKTCVPMALTGPRCELGGEPGDAGRCVAGSCVPAP